LLTKPNTEFSTSWWTGCNEVKRSVRECKKDSPSSKYEEEPPLYKFLNINN